MNETVNAGTDNEEWLMVIQNAGKSNMYGIELESTWMVTAIDTVNLGFSSMTGKYNDLIIHDDTQSSPWSTGSTSSYNMQDLQMSNLPKVNIQLGYQHTFDLVTYGMLTTNLSTNYKTKYYNNVMTYIEGAKVPAHHISDFYLNWISPEGMWSANAYVKNIENKAIAVMAQTGTDESTIMLNAPRTYGIAFKVKY